jgi:rubrerythrin
MYSDLFNIFIVIVGLITMIVFFIMAQALYNISKAVRNTNRIMSAWSKEKGIGFIYKCAKCKKTYEGKKAVCPHCGDVKTYN